MQETPWISADLEIEVRSTSLHRTQDGVEIHPAGCDFGNTEGDYTLAESFSQAKREGKRADLQSAWDENDEVHRVGTFDKSL